jgi:hypothetical protein
VLSSGVANRLFVLYSACSEGCNRVYSLYILYATRNITNYNNNNYNNGLRNARFEALSAVAMASSIARDVVPYRFQGTTILEDAVATESVTCVSLQAVRTGALSTVVSSPVDVSLLYGYYIFAKSHSLITDSVHISFFLWRYSSNLGLGLPP